MYKFNLTTEEDISKLVDAIREDDAAEVDALSAKSLEISIRDSVKGSEEAWTATFNGEVLCIFGIAKFNLLSEEACPWLMTARGIEKHRKAFLTGTKVTLDYWKARYPVLINYVDARYTRALRWAKWDRDWETRGKLPRLAN